MADRVVTECRIVARGDGIWTDKSGKAFRYPFAEVFITTTEGRTYYSRLFHPLDNNAHARSAQIQAFHTRMALRDRTFADA